MILFLYGADTYRSVAKLNAIKGQYEKAHQGRVRSFDFDCTEAQGEDVRHAMSANSLFERKKLVVLRNVFQGARFEGWLEQQKQELPKNDNRVLVFFEAGDVANKSQRKLFQWLKKHATCQEFKPLSSAPLQRWITREFSAYGLAVAPLAAEQLARRVGADLWSLSAEVRKIAAWAKGRAGDRGVQEADVKRLVRDRKAVDIFATIDAAASKNKKRGFALLYGHLEKGDSPHYLFSMLQYQFRTLLGIRDILDKKVSRQTFTAQTKLHPYVLQKGMAVAEKFSFEELKHAYLRLFELDWNIKTGRVDGQAALATFLATL